MKKLIPLFKPENFTFEIYLTEKCNYDCEYCPIHTPKIKFNKIDFNLMMSKNINPASDVYILGGEPLLHPEIDKVIEVLQEHGHKNIIIQTNLSLSEKKLNDIIKHEYIKINASFHYGYSTLNEFISKIKILDSNNKLGDIHVMWTNKNDKSIYHIYKVLKNLFNYVYLEPTLPWNISFEELTKKTELREFSKKYSANLTKDYGAKISVDGEEKTILQSYIDNDDLKVYGMKCYANQFYINYDAHLNVWRSCSTDLFRKVHNEPINNDYKICKNNFCMLDLFYEKHNCCNINT